ncbi:MAG: hypothetical protein P9M14_17170 [Candidatus Alcyoniella australis]|nr:hypothetical protein [Candidatus Alcyoniella australis]
MKRSAWLVYPMVLLLVGVMAAIAGAMMNGPGMFVADYAENSNFFTMMDSMQMGKSPHGSVQIYYSTNLKNMLGMASFTAPEGSVSIKPFDNDGKSGVDGIAVMIKKPAGYDPQNGDWMYEMRTPAGDLMKKDGMPMSGKIPMCIGCHAEYSATDYLGGTKMR